MVRHRKSAGAMNDLTILPQAAWVDCANILLNRIHRTHNQSDLIVHSGRDYADKILRTPWTDVTVYSKKKTSSYRVSRSMERIYLRASSAAQISILLPYRSLVIHFRLIVGRRRYYKIIIDSIWNWLVVAWVMQQLPVICVEWKAIKYVWFNGHLHVQIQYLISISTAIARKIDN